MMIGTRWRGTFAVSTTRTRASLVINDGQWVHGPMWATLRNRSTVGSRPMFAPATIQHPQANRASTARCRTQTTQVVGWTMAFITINPAPGQAAQFRAAAGRRTQTTALLGLTTIASSSMTSWAAQAMPPARSSSAAVGIGDTLPWATTIAGVSPRTAPAGALGAEPALLRTRGPGGPRRKNATACTCASKMCCTKSMLYQRKHVHAEGLGSVFLRHALLDPALLVP